MTCRCKPRTDKPLARLGRPRSPAARAAARHTAFTLIELLLVLVILAVLAAVVVPKFTGRSDDARIAAAKSDIATMGTMLDAFEVDNGRYPATDEGLGAGHPAAERRRSGSRTSSS